MSSDVNLEVPKVRVLVSEASRIHTRLLADSLRNDAELEVLAFDSESSGLMRAVRENSIDVLVISSNLGDQPQHGLEILQKLRTHQPATRAIVLLDSLKDELILKAFRAGARGLFSKNDALESLNECVHAVHDGKVWANSHALALAVEALANSPVVRAANSNGMNLLSKREVQVVGALAEGLTNREIADSLNLSPHTIKNYLFRIFDKLGVSSRIELLFMALSQPTPDAGFNGGSKKRDAIGFSESEAALLEKSAEAGIPTAQLALAQLHFARGRNPKDLIKAYTWYLVAMERALITHAQITKLLTQKQIKEAERNASVHIARLNRMPVDPLRP